MADEPLADPDAMWKPGYLAPDDDGGRDDPAGDGEPRVWFADYGRRGAATAAEQPPQSVPDPAPLVPTDSVADLPDVANASRRDRTARRLLVAVLAIAVVAVGAVVWQIGHQDAAAVPDQLASIPEQVVPTWTAELDTGHVTGVIGTRSTIVALELVTNDLVGLAAASGAERWRVHTAPSHSIAQLEEVDGTAVVIVEESTGDQSAAAYDIDSGERLWRVDGSNRAAFAAFQGSVYRLPAGISNVVVERLDPQTGEGRNAVTSQFSSVGWSHVSTVRDDFVEVFDLKTLERVGGPIAIGDVVAASAFDDRVVGLGRDAMIRLYGTAGDELSSLQITVDRPEQFDVTNGSDPRLLVMADQEIVGYSLTGDRISQVWRTGPVQVNAITDVGDHTYAVVQTVVAAGPNGGPIRVIDAATGDTVAEPTSGSWVDLGRDGFVVEITDDEGVRQAVEAYGYDGDRRWRFDLAREQQGVFLVDGAMVIVASDAVTQKSTLTYLT